MNLTFKGDDSLFTASAYYVRQKPGLHMIKTHGGESRGQEEPGLRDEPVSYLQVAPL